MVIEAVVFDLDGTLTSFNLDYRAVRADVRSCLIKNRLPASILSVNESIFQMLNKTEIFLRNQGNPEQVIKEVQREALEIAERYELEAAKSTSLIPGVVETLDALKRMGLNIGLFTINSQKSANHILERFQIIDYFDAVITRNRVRSVKPNIEHLGTVLEVLEVDPQEVIVVGDGINDMKCARELGAIAVGLPTGFSPFERLMNGGANYILTSISDLPALIGEIDNMLETRDEE